MHVTSPWLAGLAGAAFANALTLEKRDSPSVVTVPLKREYGNSQRLSRRSDTLKVSLESTYATDVSYVGNITFGTPPQHFEAYFETWSRGCWLLSATDPDSFCNKYDEDDPSSCGGTGGYNQSASTTAKWLDEEFWLNATDLGEVVSGTIVSDTLTFGGVTLDNINVAIVDDYSNTFSLGYGNDTATSLPVALTDSGAIKSPAFSMYDQIVLFGGVNKAMYEGDLYSVPIINGSDSPERLAISIDGISIDNTSAVADSFPMTAIIDNGYTVSFVPKSVAQALNAQIGKTSAPDEYGMVNLTCGDVGEDDTVTFTFGDLDLELDLVDFISTIAYGLGHQAPTASDKNETCYFHICENTGSDDEDIILGANFLNVVYSVFDLENDDVYLAHRNQTPSAGDDIVEITSGKGVPGSTDSAGVRIGRDLGMSALVATVAALALAL